MLPQAAIIASGRFETYTFKATFKETKYSGVGGVARWLSADGSRASYLTFLYDGLSSEARDALLSVWKVTGAYQPESDEQPWRNKTPSGGSTINGRRQHVSIRQQMHWDFT